MILRAAWVAPVSSPLIHDGFVEIADERITRIGGGRELHEPATDLGDVILTPGLVNPHTHLELTCYAGKIPPGPFWPWINQLISLRRTPGQIEREEQAVREGALQSLRAGVTCVGDISRANVHWRALKDSPIRKVCFVELLALADRPPRNMAELRSAFEEVQEDDRLTAGITPHAPYSVSLADMRAALELADAAGRPWCTHLAETREEIAFLAGEPGLPEMVARLAAECGLSSPKCDPVGLIEQAAGGLRRGALAHVNYIEDAQIERLARAGHVVVYCPRAHAFFEHPAHPFDRLRSGGVRVALGTDSIASNHSLAMLDELAFVQRTRPHVPAGDLLKMATLEASAALGLDQQIGTLEPGKLADLAAFPVDPQATDPLATLISTAPPARQVWVAGRSVLSL